MTGHLNPINGFFAVRLHYSAHPIKSQPEWIEAERKRYSPEYWRREYEIDFLAGHGIPAFGVDFAETNVLPEDAIPDPGRKVYRGWDWGMRHPALVAGQFDEEGRMLIFLERMGNNIQAETFIKRCKDHSKAHFQFRTTEGSLGEPEYVDWADWSGHHRSDKNPRTTIEIAHGQGVYPKTKKMARKPGFDLMRHLLTDSIRGKPRLMIHPRCQILTRGFRGEYPLDEKTELPAKDAFFEHVFDALRYLLCGANMRPKRPSRRDRPKQARRPLISSITGY